MIICMYIINQLESNRSLFLNSSSSLNYSQSLYLINLQIQFNQVSYNYLCQMEDIITFDLTKNQNQLKHIQNQTTKLRNQIQSKRKSNQSFVTYRAKFPKIEIVKINGLIMYDTQGAANNGGYQNTIRQERSGLAQIDINVKTIYPFKLGFVKTGAQNNPKIEQACKIKIDNVQCILIGINYPNEQLPSNHSLIHWLGILIAEQVRFSTIRAYQKYGIDNNSYDLFRALFYSFKTKNNIYNDWTGNWMEKTVKIYSGKSELQGEGVVSKLLLKI